MAGIMGKDGISGVCKWILKMQNSLLICGCIRAGAPALVVLVMEFGTSQWIPSSAYE